MLSVRSERLDRLILFGCDHLERALREFVCHYNLDRPHQSLRNELITEDPTVGSANGDIFESERLGGLLPSYRRVA